MSEFKNVILHGDAIECLRQMPDNYVHTVVTSPPYWGLRDYGVDGQIGLEKTPEEYVEKLVEVFREVKRVLRDDGTLWLNLGDTYGSPKPKDLAGIPWRVAFALQKDGWYLRSDIIWHKPNALPESVKDRPTKAHEYIFLLSKSPRYYYDADAIREPMISDKNRGGTKKVQNGSFYPFERKGVQHSGLGTVWQPDEKGRNKRTVWTVSTKPFKDAHFAVFPPDLIEPCVLAGSPEGGIVLDPFFGAGTTGLVALKHNRNFIGVELNRDYVEMAKRRIESEHEGFRVSIVEGVSTEDFCKDLMMYIP